MIFVIKDKDTNLYYSKIAHKLVELNRATTFENIELAKYYCSSSQHDLCWNYLEEKYNQDRWHLEPSFKEWRSAMDIFNNLEIIEVELNEKTK